MVDIIDFIYMASYSPMKYNKKVLTSSGKGSSPRLCSVPPPQYLISNFCN